MTLGSGDGSGERLSVPALSPPTSTSAERDPDIAGELPAIANAKALLQRVEAKDYLDILALLDHGIPLATILGAARALFGPPFNPLVAQKALAYFEGGDLASLSPDARQRLVAEAAHDLAIPVLPLASPRLD
jgi:hypothetical protein